ncbi:hypothetical protein Neosp_008091 [[Neocosmospora] mangrovei]
MPSHLPRDGNSRADIDISVFQKMLSELNKFLRRIRRKVPEDALKVAHPKIQNLRLKSTLHPSEWMR